jgi:hypothetical protein
MAIKVKDAATSAEKWGDNAARSSERFATEAVAAADAWQRNTVAAKDNYQAAITAPNISTRFARGAAKAGAAKFALKITQVARDRYAPGVGYAKDDYRANVEPYFATIAGLTLSARKPRGDPSNYRRVEEVGRALNAKRLATLAQAG